MSKLGKEWHNGHFRICLNENNAKKATVSSLQKEKKRALAGGKNAGEQQFVIFEFFFFRERDFSLVFQQIRPSAVFGARRKAALRGAGYAWTPDLRSFDKLREVGVSPYLGFIHSLSTLSMFELNEAVRGRLIGPKTWDRIDIIFETIMEQLVTVHG